ncbi:MAG: AlpA family phage regulatory protein [Rhodoferax sp.]|nr:AlpA family phage regulatory protein [Rhodoferax sp.]
MSANVIHEGLPKTGFIRQRQLIPKIIPVSAPTLWRWVKSGHFPAPVKLGANTTAWKTEDINRWMAGRVS